MKTVIITGAAGNLGQAVLNKFLAEGYRVAGTVIHEEPGKDIKTNPLFEKFAVDLMDEEKAGQFVESVISKYGTIDAAVLTVGGFAMGKMADTRTADIVKQTRLNFETAYNIARPVFVQMIRQNSGHIFLAGSRSGLDMHNAKGMVAYGLAKSLIFRLAELMNEEAKGHHVITSVIVPSTIDTPENRKAIPDAKTENWVKPEQIADLIWLYCKEETAIVREPVIKVYGDA